MRSPSTPITITASLAVKRINVRFKKPVLTCLVIWAKNSSFFEIAWTPEPSLYNGYAFRCSSATLVAGSGADISDLECHGGYKSTSVAKRYDENPFKMKNKIAKLIQVTNSFDVSWNNVNVTIVWKILEIPWLLLRFTIAKVLSYDVYKVKI